MHLAYVRLHGLSPDVASTAQGTGMSFYLLMSAHMTVQLTLLHEAAWAKVAQVRLLFPCATARDSTTPSAA